MRIDRHLAYFLSLGLFWGMSPTMNKIMADDLMPITHIIAYSGFAVGLSLALIAWFRNGFIDVSRNTLIYGLICAILMNLPFAINLYLAAYVPPTELALIMSITPFFNYVAALIWGKELADGKRLLAVVFGFASSAVLIISRGDALNGTYSLALLASFSVPFLYAVYNVFAARFWPPKADTLSVGAAESVFSGLTVLPFLLWFEPPWSGATPHIWLYWTVLAISLMWIVERIAFFTLTKERGALYTSQAIYVSTPIAVVMAMFIFGGAADIWVWISLALLMLALWLNNSKSAAIPQSA